MVTITEEAVRSLNEYFAEKEKATIRIYLANGGCAGPRLALALDNPAEGDSVFNEADLEFVVDEELLKVTGAITVDASVHGFSVVSEKPIQAEGSSCGSSCGSCGCGGSC